MLQIWYNENKIVSIFSYVVVVVYKLLLTHIIKCGRQLVFDNFRSFSVNCLELMRSLT